MCKIQRATSGILLVLAMMSVSVSGTFNCPEVCRCNTNEIRCEIDKFDSNIFRNMSENIVLYIKSGSKTVFPDNSLPRVRDLEITGDGSLVYDNAWKLSADLMQTLLLNGVRLKNASASFQILTALESITIENTTLHGIEENSFCGIKNKLGSLALENFKFTDWPIRLDTLTVLNVLFISRTDFSIFPDIKFPTGLKYLTIQKSRLTIIPKMISTLNKLVDLRLDDNEISQIENLPKKLTNAYLTGNKITKLRNIPASVTRLVVSHNNISAITEQSFAPNSQLTRLIVCYNRHTNMTITDTAFSNTPRLGYIELLSTSFNVQMSTFSDLKFLTSLVLGLSRKEYCDQFNNKTGSYICIAE